MEMPIIDVEAFKVLLIIGVSGHANYQRRWKSNASYHCHYKGLSLALHICACLFAVPHPDHMCRGAGDEWVNLF